MTHEIERHRQHISPDLPFRFESLNVRSKYQTHSVSNRLLNSGVLRFGPFVRAFSHVDLHAFQDKVYIVYRLQIRCPIRLGRSLPVFYPSLSTRTSACDDLTLARCISRSFEINIERVSRWCYMRSRSVHPYHSTSLARKKLLTSGFSPCTSEDLRLHRQSSPVGPRAVYPQHSQLQGRASGACKCGRSPGLM